MEKDLVLDEVPEVLEGVFVMIRSPSGSHEGDSRGPGEPSRC